MRRKCVFYFLAITALILFLFIIAGRMPFAAGSAEAKTTSGLLDARDKAGKALGLCPLVHTEVKAEISGILSRVTVRQQFRNPYEQPIEAVYTFPLPHNAAVDDMTIRTGERTIRAVIKRREEAKEIYQRARENGQLAALLDQERPNIFSQQIANVLPGQDVDVVISYAETLKYKDGGYSFIFPMVVGPRYIPGDAIGQEGGGWAPDTTQVPDASRITPPVAPPGTRSGHDIDIQVRIDSGVPFSKLRSPQHQLNVLSSDIRSAVVELANKKEIPNKDFVLSYDVAGPEIQDGLVTHRISQNGYFMLILQPPQTFTPKQVVPKELVFVLDTSGSMQGFPIEKAKETMRMALDGLYSHDTFNLITFSGETRILFPQPVPATRENLELARQMLESGRGSGGTEMMRAIRAALQPSDAQGHIRIVCFMTDGQVGNDMAILSEVQKHPNARVFAFGIGPSTNRFLLDKISEEGRGAVEYVPLNGDATAAATRFHERIRNPLLTDIALEWSGTPVTDIYPRRIPDLFSAEPIAICGRYAGSGYAALRLRGRSGSRDFLRDIPIYLPGRAPQHDVLAKLWARRRIEALMAEDYKGIQNGSPRAEVREAITRLGLDHRIMTQFTSFVAVEERIQTKGGKPITVQVPTEIPDGVSYEGIFGDAAFVMPSSSTVAGGVAGGVVAGFTAPLAFQPPPPSVAPPLPAKRAPIRVGGSVMESRLIRKVDPQYPKLAHKARVEGSVLLELMVDENGSVAGTKVIQGHPLLTQAAVDAVRQWKYVPAILNGSPAAVNATVTVKFKLDTPVKPRVDPAIARVIARLEAGQAAGTEAFIVQGKAKVELVIPKRSREVEEKLQSIGFEVISWPKDSSTVIGRIAASKLELLLDIDAIESIAPH